MIALTRRSHRRLVWFGLRITLITAVLVAMATPGVAPTLTVQRFGICPSAFDLSGVAALGPSCPPLLTFSTPLPGGEVGVAYTPTTLTASGGSTPLTWSVSAGSLPTGITLAPTTGVLSGTPTASGTASFTIKITDFATRTATKDATLTVVAAPSVTSAAPASGVVGTAYSTTFTSSGGTAPNVWSVSVGSLPAGLTLNPSTGVLSGTPTSAGTTDFTVKVTDANNQFATRAVSLLIKSATSVALSTSVSSVSFGTSVTLTATVTPSDATGSVTFTVVPAVGWQHGLTLTLGSGTISGGVATLTVPLPAFAANPVTADYPGDGTHTAATSNTSSVEVTGYTGEIIVNEFRSSGPGGADDSYIELYNTGALAPLGGFTVATTSGTSITVPNDVGPVGTKGSYLITGGAFSLSSVANTHQSASTLGSGGIRVRASDTAGTQTDAVGPATGYHRGTGLAALTGTPTDQYAWVRAQSAGRPADTGSNADDFRLVSTTGGLVGDVQSALGSPAPTGWVSGEPRHNGELPSTLLEPGVGPSATPNRAYTPGSPGTLVIRRTITNNTGGYVPTVKVRITALSEANGAPWPGVGSQPTNVAHLRVVNPATATSSITVTGGGSVTVQNLSVDAPAYGATTGGGLNSTLTVPLPGNILAPGETVSIAITLAVDTTGTFWLGYNVDALLDTS